MDKDEYMNNPAPLCEYCGKPSTTVKQRVDPFEFEIYHSTVEVRMCNPCAREKAMDV